MRSVKVGWREAALVTAAATAWVALVRPGPLSLPYFWDEADVYVPGARWVAEHGLSVLPGHFPDDYSRGHPPLLFLLAGIAFSLFGTSPVVGHLVVLPFTVAALAGTYALGAALFDRRVGVASAVLLGATPLFMSIGNMLLPEMPLVGLSVLALLALSRGRLGLAVFLGVALVWIKETGIFTAAAIGVAVLVDARMRGPWRESARRIALATLPLLALLAFIGWQKVYAGYFIFPHHQNLFADRPFGAENALTVWPSLLLWHGRWVLAAAALIALAMGLRRPATTDVSSQSPWQPSRAAVIAACLALVFFNALFFAKMFWLERYALPAHPGLLVILVGLVLSGFAKAPPWARGPLSWSVLGAATAIGALGLRAPTAPDTEEHTFAYADVIATHQTAFAALDADDAPVLTTWPMTVELEQPYLGYVSRPLDTNTARFDEHDELQTDGTEAAVLVNVASRHADTLRAFADDRGLHLAETFRVGNAPALELYR